MNNVNEFSLSKILGGEDMILDKFESIELGKAKEIISDELYLPVHSSREWVHCILFVNANSFKLYTSGEVKRFLLCAKRFSNDCFHISMHENFVELESKPNNGFIATLDRINKKNSVLKLNICHLCDIKLGSFNCGRFEDEKETISLISQRFHKYDAINAEFRKISVLAPKIGEDGYRKIWCPRSFRKIHQEIKNDEDISTLINRFPDMRVKFVNKLPEWNPDMGSLVVKFKGGGRDLLPSSKNFLLYEEINIPQDPVKKYGKNDEIEIPESPRLPNKMNIVDSRKHSNSKDFEIELDITTPRIRSKRNISFSNNDESQLLGSSFNDSFDSLDLASTNYDSDKSSPLTNSSKKSSKLFQNSFSDANRKVVVDDKLLLQFGKSSKHKYILDFRFPFSPIQAFGVAISVFFDD